MSAGTPSAPGAQGVRAGLLAGGADGPGRLRDLTTIVLDALEDAPGPGAARCPPEAPGPWP